MLVNVLSDYSKGFGGKYGVQKDSMDKSAVGFDYQEKHSIHESQTGEGHDTMKGILSYSTTTPYCY
jgi:hypothetical protein